MNDNIAILEFKCNFYEDFIKKNLNVDISELLDNNIIIYIRITISI